MYRYEKSNFGNSPIDIFLLIIFCSKSEKLSIKNSYCLRINLSKIYVEWIKCIPGSVLSAE